VARRLAKSKPPTAALIPHPVSLGGSCCLRWRCWRRPAAPLADTRRRAVHRAQQPARSVRDHRVASRTTVNSAAPAIER